MRIKNIYKKFIPSSFRSFIRREILKRDYTLTYEELFLKKKIIFIHIPKTAGISISKAIFNRDSTGHQYLAYFQERFTKNQFEKCFKFTFSRNPYDRVYSAYNYLLEGGRKTKIDLVYQKIVREYVDFEDFILRFINSDMIYKVEHFIPQSFWVKNIQGKVDIDFIGRFENLEEDFLKVCNKLSLECVLPSLNLSIKDVSDLSNFFNEETKAVIDKIYAEDFSTFGYKMEL